jgi:hypothetical protein
MTYMSWPLLVGLMCVFGVLRRKRARIYESLTKEQQQLIKRKSGSWDEWLKYPTVLPSFGHKIISVPEILTSPCLAHIRLLTQDIRRNERSYIPTHKQGGTISYEHLHACAPDLVALYQSPGLQELISKIVGERVVPTPVHDQSSCSLLIYERQQDHIGWHYDHNFYSGRHFTVLLSIINEDMKLGGLSAVRLQARINGEVTEIPTPPNTLVVFEGAHIMHRATKLGPDQKRVLLSMTFCTDPRAPWHRAVMRRCKDTAYYGIRALWT